MRPVAPPRRGRSAFVGREVEFSELTTGVDKAIAGQGRGFLVLGDPGIGKTRWAREVADHAHNARALVLWGRCWDAGGRRRIGRGRSCSDPRDVALRPGRSSCARCRPARRRASPCPGRRGQAYASAATGDVVHGGAARTLPVDAGVAHAWAALRLALRDTGQRMPINDSWIAATAIVNRIPVASQDADYDDVPGWASYECERSIGTENCDRPHTESSEERRVSHRVEQPSPGSARVLAIRTPHTCRPPAVGMGDRLGNPRCVRKDHK